MNEEKKIDCPYAEKGCSRELSECIKRHFTDYPKPCSYLEIEEVFFCEEVDEMLERYYALCAQAHRKQSEGEWKKTCVPDVFQCSACKRSTKMDWTCDSAVLRAFCPECGAKMKGGAE